MDLWALLRVRPALRTSQELKEIKAQLQGCPFFADWADESLTQISGVLGCVSFAAGEKVTEPGEAVYSIFILLAGSCDLAVPHPTDPRVAPQHRALAPGDVCGREAVLSHDPRARGRITAGPDGALLATLSNSAWADVCARAATGSPVWAATRADLMCAFLRQLVGAAAAPAAAVPADPQLQSQQANAGSSGGPGGNVAGAGAAEGKAEAGGGAEEAGPASEGPAEALRLELMAVLLASLPSTMSAMPQGMLREAARGCYVRVVHPYGVLYDGTRAPSFQVVLLSGELQVRQLKQPDPPSSTSAPNSRRSLLPASSASSASLNAAAATAVATSTAPVARPGSPGSEARSTGALRRRRRGAAAGAASAVDAGSEAAEGSQDAAGPTESRGAGEAGAEGEGSAGENQGKGEGEAEGEGGEGEDSDSDSSDSTSTDGEGDEVEGDTAAAAEQEEQDEHEEDDDLAGADEDAKDASLSAEEAEGRLAERFGPVVCSETRGSVLMELPLTDIARRGRARNAKPAAGEALALTAGAAPATVLVVPLASLRRGYAAARASLVAARVAALSALKPLGTLNAAELAGLALAARPLWLAGGAVVARQGDPVDALYLVQEGEVRLLDDPDGAAHHHRLHHHGHHHHHLHSHHHPKLPDGKDAPAPAPTPASSSSSGASASDSATRAALHGSYSSSLLLSSFLEDPVMSSEGSKPPWMLHSTSIHSHTGGHHHTGHHHHHHSHHHHHHHHGHGHHGAHQHSHEHGGAAAGGGGAVALDLSAAKVQRSLAQLVPLMMLEPGGLLGESVLGYLSWGAASSERQLRQEAGGGGAAEEPSGQLPALSSPSAAAPPHLAPPAAGPTLTPAPPPTALPAAMAARSPLQQRQSILHRPVAGGAATAPSGSSAATAGGSESAPPPNLASAGAPSMEQSSPTLLQQDQQQLPDAGSAERQGGGELEPRLPPIPSLPALQPPPPSSSRQTTAQQQQITDNDHNDHHKQLQHLHRLLTKHTHDHLQATDNHHHNRHNGQLATDVTTTRMSTGNMDLGTAVHSHARRRGSVEIPTGLVSPQPQTHNHPAQLRRSLEIPGGGGGSTASPPYTSLSSPGAPAAGSGSAVNVAAVATDPTGPEAAVSAGQTAAARSGVFPATAVAVGAVRLLALPREALLRCPQLQPVLAALATGQLRILELRRRDAQETRDRLAAAAAAAAADGTANTDAPGAAAAAAAKDPYAVTHRRQAERRAAVGSLNGGAAALRAPEVRPTDDMIARPSVVLEKMGFKVPKLRGVLLPHNTSTSTSQAAATTRRSHSRRASEALSPLPLPAGTTAPSSSQPEGIVFSSSPQSSSPKSPAPRISINTGELAFLGGGMGPRSHSVTFGFTAAAAAGSGGGGGAAAGARLPALPRFASGAVGASLDADFDAAGRRGSVGGGGGGGGLLLGRDSADGFRAAAAAALMPELSGGSFSGGGGGKYSVPLPRITTDELRALRASRSGSARAERINNSCGVATTAPSEARSNSGSPMRRSPRVYDMDAFVSASAAASRVASRAGSFSGTPGQGGGSGGGLLLARAVFGAPPAGVELLASTGSPRNVSLSGATTTAAATDPPVRTVSFSNLSRLVVPTAALDDGPPGRSRHTGTGAVSPVPPAVGPPATATGRRPQWAGVEDGRLPALPSPQRPSRMFQEEAAAATAALLRGVAGSPTAPPPPPSRPGGAGKAMLQQDDLAAVSRWMEENVGGGGGGGGGSGGGGGGSSASTLLRRMFGGGQQPASNPQSPLPPGSAPHKPQPPSSAAAAGSLDAATAVAALRRGSMTSSTQISGRVG